ncbi:MAG: WD40 repeat domain-containing protein [Chloroflexi bacterium]|uniref:WD40 repeat domain-containing protein n=1 Tax=Candidatus Flexifilum breve TaxID=3140694 RepID=UPI00313580E0|nr:WD40 repeat domain-containing protein [Chloroflexota bacterium]
MPQKIRSHLWQLLFIVIVLVMVSSFGVSAQTLERSLDIAYSVDDIAWSPDGTLIAVSGSEGIWIYTATLEPRVHFQQDRTRYTTSIAWSPNSARLATVGNGAILIWRRSTDDTFTLETSVNLDGYVQLLVAWSPDGTLLASQDVPDLEDPWGASSRIQLWNTTSWALERTIADNSYRPGMLIWNTSSTQLATTTDFGRNVILIDVASGQQLAAFPAVEAPSALDWSVDNLLSVGGGTYLTTRSADDGHILSTFLYPQLQNVRELAWSSDGTQLLINEDRLEAGVLDFATGQRIGIFPNAYELTWSPDGKTVAAAGVNLSNNSITLNVWDVSQLSVDESLPTWTPYPMLTHESTPTSVPSN